MITTRYGRRRNGHVKPNYLGLINWSSPMCDGLLSLICPNHILQGAGGIFPDYYNQWDLKQERQVYDASPTTTRWINDVRQDGWAVTAAVQDNVLDVSVNAAAATGIDFIPLNRVTIAVLRRRTDPPSTLRAAALVGTYDGLVNNQVCELRCPHSDGHWLWDFGGRSGANRLDAGILTLNNELEHIVAIAGTKGMKLWRENILVASSATPVSRAAQGLHVYINRAVFGAGDLNEFYLVAIIDAEWEDELVHMFFEAPYDMIRALDPPYGLGAAEVVFMPPGSGGGGPGPGPGGGGSTGDCTDVI